MRGEETYLDYLWSGSGRDVDEAILADVEALGWRLVEPGEGNTTRAADCPDALESDAKFVEVTERDASAVLIDDDRAELARQAGGLLTLTAAAERLDMTTKELHRPILDGRVLGMMRDRQLLVPEFQFVEVGGEAVVMPGIPEVLAVFREDKSPGWPVLQFPVGASPNLQGGTPMDALAEGRVAAVVHAARAHLNLDDG